MFEIFLWDRNKALFTALFHVLESSHSMFWCWPWLMLQPNKMTRNVNDIALRFMCFLLQVLLSVKGNKSHISLSVSLVWKRAGSGGGVGVHACMWKSLSTVMLFSTLGKGSTVTLLHILGGWARRARWWFWMQHSQAWTQRMLTFAFVDCCRERKNLLFHMLVLAATLPSTHYTPYPHPPTALLFPPLSSLNQMAPWTLFTLGDGPRCSVSIGIPIPPS